MQDTIFNQDWDKKEFILYFELLYEPLQKKDLLEFNKPLLPENKNHRKSKFSVASYLATRQNLNTLIAKCLEKNIIIEKDDKYGANENLLNNFEEKELMLEIWRKKTTPKDLLEHLHFFDETYSKKVKFIQVLNPIMISVLNEMLAAFDRGDNITKLRCEKIEVQHQTISTNLDLQTAIKNTEKRYKKAYE